MQRNASRAEQGGRVEKFGYCLAPPDRLTIAAMTRIRLISAVFASLLLVGGIAVAQKPRRNISAGRHPNLAAAQRLSRQAWERVADAQKANEWDLKGHARKAKDLLDEVNRELKLAAEASNQR